LTPASGRQDHTTSPSAPASFVLHAFARLTLPRPPHPAPTFVTIAKRPSDRDGTYPLYCCFYQIAKRNIFCQGAGHDFRERRPSGKSPGKIQAELRGPAAFLQGTDLRQQLGNGIPDIVQPAASACADISAQ
jgi:hypothetical protein